jgi:1-pyrroline-5-carboxylate dehydrogenase
MPALHSGHFFLARSYRSVTKVTSIHLACRLQMAIFALHKINPLKVMPKGIYNIPHPQNEPVMGYAPGSKERQQLQAAYHQMKNQAPIDVPMYIGNKEVRTDKKIAMSPPHDHQQILGHFNRGTAEHVQQAIDAALAAKTKWAELPWEQRASIFLKAADLLAGPFRARMNAATMLAQSKNAYQAEIDAACELIDFLRFNVAYMQQIYRDQPGSNPGVWNRMEYRPLEGFVFALTPFNFTSIAANLCAAPALMGNTVVWKPADSQVYSAQIIMEIFKAAGLPDGVVNMVTVSGQLAGEVIFSHKDFAGLHFTGSTGVFKSLWKTIGSNIDLYRSYPRVVGETGGKDFVVAHHTANAAEVATALTRGAFEYQGQKCSAASRAYIPDNIWPEVKKQVIADLASFKMGSPEDFGNFINAVIDKRAFDKISEYIDYAKSQSDAEIIAGGKYDGSKGYFIEPTVIVTSNPKFRTICEEIFGPVLTIHVYKKDEFEETLKLVDSTSEYALTGSILAGDRYAIELATKMLSNAAGNFYINDKPTGAVVGQQPFGGARGSGTNDKAGSYLNLIRWVSPRTIKETFVPPTDYRYPFLG